MNNRISKDGKGLEKLVSFIYETLKDNPESVITHDVKLSNIIGLKSQFDVIIRTQIADHSSMVAIECKDYADKVTISEMHDFEGRCRLVKGIDKKIFVAVNGYQKGAKEVAKQLYDIELYDLNTISPELLFNWIIPSSLKAGYFIGWDLKSITLYTVNGRSRKFDIIDLDPKTKVINQDGEMGTIAGMTHELVEQNQDALKSKLGDQFESIEWNEDIVKATIPVPYDPEGMPFAVVLNGDTIPLKTFVLELEASYEITKPNGLITRQYKPTQFGQRESKKVASTLSGTLLAKNKRFNFDIIKSEENGIVRVFTRDVSGKLVAFKEKGKK